MVLVGTTKVPVGLSGSFTSERENTTEKHKSPNQKRRMCNYWYKPAASALMYVAWLFQDGAASPHQEKVQLTSVPRPGATVISASTLMLGMLLLLISKMTV